MYKIFLFISIVLFFLGCSNKDISPSEKAFNGEDLYIFYALRSENIGNYNQAAIMYKKLYDSSNKKEYLYHSIKNFMASKKFDTAIKITNRALDDDPNDYKLIRLKILSLIHLKKFEEAKKIAKDLVSRTKLSDDYLLVADIYLKEKKFKMKLF